MTIFYAGNEVELTPLSLHIASITPDRPVPKPSFRKRFWRLVIDMTAMAMLISVIPAAFVLAMRAALAVAR